MKVHYAEDYSRVERERDEERQRAWRAGAALQQLADYTEPGKVAVYAETGDAEAFRRTMLWVHLVVTAALADPQPAEAGGSWKDAVNDPQWLADRDALAPPAELQPSQCPGCDSRGEDIRQQINGDLVCTRCGRTVAPTKAEAGGSGTAYESYLDQRGIREDVKREAAEIKQQSPEAGGEEHDERWHELNDWKIGHSPDCRKVGLAEPDDLCTCGFAATEEV